VGIVSIYGNNVDWCGVGVGVGRESSDRVRLWVSEWVAGWQTVCRQ